MIKDKDVTTLRMPFPDVSSGLALAAHMYICYESGENKKMLKVQSLKPRHLMEMPVNSWIVEDSDIQRNPFKHKSFIDLDKCFLLEKVRIDTKVLTTSRRDICDDLYNQIQSETNYLSLCRLQNMDTSEVLTLNRAITPIQ